MPKPIIAVTTWRKLDAQNYASFHLAEAYIEALTQSGASPLMIPLGLSEDDLENLLVGCDGVVFSGGGDIAPQFYGAPPSPTIKGIDADRDRLELALFRLVMENRTPFLAICRGMQLINVALGGTLYADIASCHAGAIKHDYLEKYARNFRAHEIRISPGSRLEGILGCNSLEVNSIHHQAVERLAPSLIASAISPDDLVEAVELSDHPFGIGVQWHPECLLEMAEMRKLFRSFVSAADGESG
ncbi:MAG: gamma-glutamyl-gamma-aminobutyrate hydrolase family protein [Anaerolineales bacterium]